MMALRVQTLLDLSNASAFHDHSVDLSTDRGNFSLAATSVNAASAKVAWGASDRAAEADKAGFGKCPAESSSVQPGNVELAAGVTLLGSVKADDFVAALAKQTGVDASKIRITAYTQTTKSSLSLPIAASALANTAARTQLATAIADTLVVVGSPSPLVTLLSGWWRRRAQGSTEPPRRVLRATSVSYQVVSKADISSSLLSSDFGTRLGPAIARSGGALPAISGDAISCDPLPRSFITLNSWYWRDFRARVPIFSGFYRKTYLYLSVF